MKTGYKFVNSGSYIHIVETEDFTQHLPPISVFWNRLADFCRENYCKKVLVEAPIFSNKMTTVEAFELGETAGKKIPGLSIACRIADFEVDRTVDFFKTVAQNRGVRIEFFVNAKDALKWLGVSLESEKT